jgi:hypothetical protein
MIMKNTMILILMITLLAAYPTVAAEPNQKAPAKLTDVNEIVNKANLAAYYAGDDGKASVKMTITDKNGQKRSREFTILRKDLADGGDQNYYVYFQRPADVSKTVFMVHKHADIEKDDDRWLYLPALDLVNRIAATDKRTSFVGSDFLYEDVSGRSLAEDKHELIETTENSYIVKNIPKQPDTVEFAYYNVHIDANSFMPRKMEYFDKNNKLYRTIESKNIEKIQGFTTVTTSIVKDFKKQSTTEMQFTNVQYNIKLKDIFKERYLRRVPRQARR